MAQDSMRTGSAGHGHRRLALSPSMRKIVLTAHIIVSVELLGDSAAFLAVAIRAATMVDPLIAHASYELLRMFSNVFGIPLSFAAPLIGLLLGIGTKWGVFRHGWVVIKLLLIVSVMLVGGLVFDGGIDATLSGDGGAEGRLIAGAAYDVVALTVATALSVFKPRRGGSFAK